MKGGVIKNFEVIKSFFREKVSQCRKKLKGDPLGFFNIHYLTKHYKIEGDPMETTKIQKKLHSARKKMKGGTIRSRPVLYVTFKKQKNKGGPFAKPFPGMFPRFSFGWTN